MTRLWLALLPFLPAASAQAADTSLGEVDAASVAAWHGRLAWSAPAPGGGQQLMTRAPGSTTPEALPVPGKRNAFDVDLGPGPDGGPVAVYSRNGRVALYDFATQRERTLPARGVQPAIWRDRLVVRRRRWLYLIPVAGGPARRVPGSDDVTDEPDLFGRWLGFPALRATSDLVVNELRLHKIGGSTRVIAEATSGLENSVDYNGVTFDHGALYAAKVRFLAPGRRFLRYRLRDGRLHEITGRTGILDAAFDGGRALFVATGDEEGAACEPCRLALTPRLPFP